MPYHSHGLNLTKKQAERLAGAHTIRLLPHQMKGPHMVYLTKTQLNKMKKSHLAGHGLNLNMSVKQLEHHIRKGGSIISDILGGLKQAGKWVYEKALPVGEELINKVVIPRASKKAEDILGSLLTKGGLGMQKERIIDRSLLEGEGVKKRRGRPKKHVESGEGFWDDAWNGIKSVGNFAVDKVLPVAAPLLLKSVLGGSVKKKARKGASITLPGGSLLKKRSKTGSSITLPGAKHM